MRKAPIITLAALLAGCADTIPAPKEIPNPTPLRDIFSNEQDSGESLNEVIAQSPDLVISGYLQSPEEQSGIINPEESSRCGDPKDYNVRTWIDFAQDTYLVGEPVVGEAGIAFVGPLNPMILIEASRAGRGSGIGGFAVRDNPRPEWGVLKAYLYGMSPDGGGSYFRDGVPTFAEPGTYQYNVHVFDCDCIEEQLGVANCFRPFRASDFDQLPDYFEAINEYYRFVLETIVPLDASSRTIIGE